MCLWWYIHCSIVKAACLILLAGVVQITDNKRTCATKTDVKNGLTEPLKSTGKWSYKDALNQMCCMKYVICSMSQRSQHNGLLCSLKCDESETKRRRNRKISIGNQRNLLELNSIHHEHAKPSRLRVRCSVAMSVCCPQTQRLGC